MQWAALNDGGRVADPASAASARVTSEAEESRLTSSYEAALYFIRDGNREDAARDGGAPAARAPPNHSFPLVQP